MRNTWRYAEWVRGRWHFTYGFMSNGFLIGAEWGTRDFGMWWGINFRLGPFALQMETQDRIGRKKR